MYPWYLPGCKCDFCQDRFKRDTGLTLPEKLDYDDMTFKQWIMWRYDVLMEVWKACVDSVTAVRADAVVCFNNYRRRNNAPLVWNTGIPMRTLDWDCMMSAELDGFSAQSDMQMKMQHAYKCTRGVETWWPLRDHGGQWVPDFDTLPAVNAGIGTVSAGGAMCMGIGVAPDLVAEPLRKIQSEMAPRIEFNDGDPLEYAAIWCSQQDQDFSSRDNPHEAWDRWHGANELCRHLHVQSGVVFDDHIDRGELSAYKVLLAGGTRCISDSQAEAIRNFVNDGGILVACDEVGILDEWGRLRETGALDDLLGIVSRSASVRYKGWGTTLEIRDEQLRAVAGDYVTYRWQESDPIVAVPADAADA